MSFSKQGFIKAIECLNSGTNTKEANKYLLALEESPQSWKIALQLLEESSEQVRLYGATLINKKILQITDTPYNTLSGYLLAKVNDNQNYPIITNQLCGAISKLLVNDDLLMTGFIQSTNQIGIQEMKLKILKEIPVSICCHTKSILEHKGATPNQFKTIIPLLIRAWNHTQLVLEVIENYSQFCRIDILYSDELLIRLFSLPIESTQRILNDYLSYSDRDNPEIALKLGPYILSFINDERSSENRGYISLFIQLSRYLLLSPMSLEDLKLMLFNMLKLILKSRDLIMDSGEFWMEITEIFVSEQRTPEERLVLCQALETLNKKALEFSLLKQLIPRNTQKVIEISSDQQSNLGLELGETANNFQSIETDVLTFRETAQDIFRMAYKIIRTFPQRLNPYFSQLYQIIVKGKLQLQLVVFNLKSIIDSIEQSQEQNYVSTIINMLVDHFQDLPQQILIPFTQLLYDCDYIFTTNVELTEKCLNIFLKMLGFREVQKLLSQTIENIVETVCKSNSNTRVLLQGFVSRIFEGITDIEDNIVRDSILGALVTLVLHQENSVESYTNLLQMVLNKIQELPFEKQYQFVHSIIFVHFLKVSDQRLYECFGGFIKSMEERIIRLYETSNYSKKTQLLCLLAKSAKKFGQYIPDTMTRLAKYFIQTTIATNSNLNYSISLLASLIELPQSDNTLYSQLLAETLPLIGSVVMSEEKPQIMVSYIILYSSLSNIGYSLDYTSVFHEVQRVLGLPFNYEVTREVLKYFLVLIRKKVRVEEILAQTMKMYHKLADIFHQQLTSILIESYKLLGQLGIKKSLQTTTINSTPEEYQNLNHALINHDPKLIKKSLLTFKP